MLRLLFFLVPLVLSIYCIVEAISSRDDEVRNLSKVWWILLVLFFPFVGSIAWLVAGRPQRAARRHGPHERSAGAFPEYDRPGRFAAADPAADEAFLKKVRERAEEQRRRAREQQARRRRRARVPSPVQTRRASPARSPARRSIGSRDDRCCWTRVPLLRPPPDRRFQRRS